MKSTRPNTATTSGSVSKPNIKGNPDIDNFFGQWFKIIENKLTKQKTFDLVLRRQLYSQLLSPDFKSKAMVSDNEITSTTIPSLTFIYKLFLHAILVDQKDWSPLFTATLKKNLEFFDSKTKEPKNNVYQTQLIPQIKYLLTDEKERTILKKPYGMIILPGQFQTLPEYQICHQLLDEKMRDQVYSSYKTKIHSMMKEFLDDKLNQDFIQKIKLFSLVPEKYRFEVLKEIMGIETLKNNIKNYHQLSILLNILPQENIPVFFEQIIDIEDARELYQIGKKHFLGKTKFGGGIKSYKELKDLLVRISSENQYIALTKIFDAKFFKDFENNILDVVEILKIIKPNSAEVFLNYLKEINFTFPENPDDLIEIIHTLPQNKFEVINALWQKSYRQIFQEATSHQLYQFIISLPLDDRIRFLSLFTEDMLATIITTPLSLSFIKELPENDQASFLKSLSPYLYKKIFNDKNSFILGFSIIPPKQLVTFLHLFDPTFYKKIFPNANAFLSTLSNVPGLNNFSFIHILGEERFIAITKDEKIDVEEKAQINSPKRKLQLDSLFFQALYFYQKEVKKFLDEKNHVIPSSSNGKRELAIILSSQLFFKELFKDMSAEDRITSLISYLKGLTSELTADNQAPTDIIKTYNTILDLFPKNLVESIKTQDIILGEPRSGLKLIQTIKTGSLDDVKKLVASNAEFNYKTSKNESALSTALVADKIDVFNYLLSQNNIDIEVSTESNQTILLKAIALNKPAFVKSLLEKKADTNYTIGNKTLIQFSLENSFYNIARDLIENEAKNGMTESLAIASIQCNARSPLHIYLEQKGNPDLKDSDGRSLLLLACQEGHKEIAEDLLKHKANFNNPCGSYNTPLYQAAKWKHLELVNLLLEAGASPIGITSTDNKITEILEAAKKKHQDEKSKPEASSLGLFSASNAAANSTAASTSSESTTTVTPPKTPDK